MAESTARQFERNKKKRTVHRQQLSKLINKIEKIIDDEQETSTEILDGLLEQIAAKDKVLKDLNAIIENELDDEELESDILASEVYETDVIKTKAKIKWNLQPEARSRRRLSSTASSDTVLGNEDVRRPVARTRLPKLELGKFYGEVSQWMQFWPQFEVAIHKDESLGSIDKFVYLKSYLGGTALNSITGLTLSEENYFLAIKNLKERFGMKDVIRNTHTNRLLDMSPVRRSSDLAALRRLYDHCEIEVRSLINLGEATGKYAGVISSIILKLVPPDIALEYCRQKPSSEEAEDVNQLLAFIRHEVESRERSLSYTRSVRRLHEPEETRRSNRPPDHKPFKTGNKFDYPPRFKPPSEHSAAALHTLSKTPETCMFCEEATHRSENCEKYQTVEKRKTILLKKGRCYVCVSGRHLERDCRVKLACSHCQKRHHISVCGQRDGNNEDTTKDMTVQLSASSYTRRANTILLQTAVVRLQNGTREKLIRVLLDGGSQRTFIKRSTSHDLNFPVVGEELLQVHVFGNESPKPMHCRRVEVTIKSLFNEKVIKLEAVESEEITTAKIEVPGNVIGKEIGQRSLRFADQIPNGEDCSDEIHILIGTEYYWSLLNGNIERLNENLVSIESEFGWLIHGPVSILSMQVSSGLSTTLITNVVSQEEELNKILRSHWEIESLGIVESENQSSMEHQEALRKFEQGIQFINQRYQVSLPWRDEHLELTSNYSGAKRRFLSLTRRFRRDPLLYSNYESIIQEYEDKGIIKEVTSSGNDSRTPRLFYLPHQPVIKSERTTTKVRIVFDGSAHDVGNPSLNECLLSGPNLNPDLLDVLVRFRKYKVAYMSDVAQAFLQISLKQEDRNSVRFLWSKNPLMPEKDMEIKTYCFTRVLFGLTSSPFLLSATVRYHVKKYEGQYETTCKKLNEDLYVDDLISGAHSDNDAFEESKQAKAILKDANMSLRKWQSNSRDLEDRWRKEGWIEPTTEDISFASPCALKVLGLSWDKKKDVFFFKVEGLLEYISSLKDTKRCILSASARIFDPLGLVMPFTITVKILFQAIWEKGCSWDEELPSELTRRWKSWCSDLPTLNELTIPRSYLPSSVSILEASVQLHCFTDASQRAYGACLYVRSMSKDGLITVSLIGSRSRVAPIKQLTIPRLELMGALVGARFTHRIRNNFKDKNPKIYYWSDSDITIHWIKGQASRWKPFVNNRVVEIQQLSEPQSWNHCPGLENPADYLSRGQAANELTRNFNWWRGPPWLSLPEIYWPKNTPVIEEDDVREELRAKQTTTAQNLCNVRKFEPMLTLDNFSAISRVLRVTAWVIRYVSNLKKTPETRTSGVLTAEELKTSELYWIRLTQQQSFPEELNSLKLKQRLAENSTILKYNPILDDDGIIRIGGRLQCSTFSYDEKHPIILPDGHKFSLLQIDYAHEKVLHLGTSSTMAKIRKRFWILKARQQVKKRIGRCLICKKLRVKPTKEETAPLPADRVRQAEPFEVTGLDFAGPIFTKGANERQKSYIALFTCGVTRALHLEMVSDLSTKSFLLAFRRFISRRGMIKVVYSDNALTFKRADRELQLLWKRINNDEVKEFFGQQGVVWKYIVERAAWWGGFYERLVRSTKSCLKKILGRSFLSFEELTTVLTEVEAVLNSRPITYVGEEYDEEPLTPSHFLTGHRVTSLPPDPKLNSKELKDELRRRWKLQQRLLDHFWKRWRKEYILELRSAHQVSQKTSSLNVKPGELALLKDDNLPRHMWKMVRIEEVFEGRDGKLRSCSIRLPSQVILKRPIDLICPLEIN